VTGTQSMILQQKVKGLDLKSIHRLLNKRLTFKEC